MLVTHPSAQAQAAPSGEASGLCRKGCWRTWRASTSIREFLVLRGEAGATNTAPPHRNPQASADARS